MDFEEKTLKRTEIYQGPIFNLVKDKVQLQLVIHKLAVDADFDLSQGLQKLTDFGMTRRMSNRISGGSKGIGCAASEALANRSAVPWVALMD